MDKGFTTVQFMSRCAFFCTLCILANYMLIFSLRILDATIAMAMFSCTVSIIYLFSWVVLHQQFVGVRVCLFIWSFMDQLIHLEILDCGHHHHQHWNRFTGLHGRSPTANIGHCDDSFWFSYCVRRVSSKQYKINSRI